MYNEETEQLYWLWLSSITKMGRGRKAKLLAHFGSPQAVFEANREQRKACSWITPADLEKLEEAPIERAQKAAEFIVRHGITFLPITDPRFPNSLRHIPDPPLWLFCKGHTELFNKPVKIAVVGSRKASPAGKYQAGRFASALSAADIVVVSGLAEGIDGAAHRGALRYSGSTIAVIASGINVLYPKTHAQLFREIVRDGLVVTEHFLDENPLSYHFPLRNRIITGLSDGVLVVEAAKKSGALITANHALSQGKEVYAIPQSIEAAQSEGVNNLLKDGAMLVTNPSEILSDLQESLARQLAMTDDEALFTKAFPEDKKHAAPKAVKHEEAQEPNLSALDPESRALLALIREGFNDMDLLLEKTDYGIAELNTQISLLELEELISISFGKIYLT